MSKEAMKLALEALKLNNDEWKALADSGDTGNWAAEDQDHYKQTNEAIAAIEALAEQPAQQEPVAVRLWDSQWVNVVNHDNCYRDWSKEDAINHAVKMTEKYIAGNVASNKLPPAQRTWVGLTHEEHMEVMTGKMTTSSRMAAVEAKLKEKNT